MSLTRNGIGSSSAAVRVLVHPDSDGQSSSWAPMRWQANAKV